MMREIISFLLLITTIHPLAAQAPDSIAGKFNAYRDRAFHEKIYVFTDNDFYVAGEYIWLKPYIVEGTFHTPADISKVIYIEIIDQNNHAVLQAKVPAMPTQGETSLYLPATIETGSYTLRAYTNWMKNFPAEFFFQKPITIVNTFKKLETRTETAAPDAYEFQLFPEGGNLVAGIRSKVAFKINDHEGNGLPYHGWVLNDANDTVARFIPLRFGLGHFYFTPEAGRTYKIQIRDGKGTRSDFKLPQIKPSGFVLHLNTLDEHNLEIKVTSTDASGALYLFIHTGNEISKSAVANIHSNQAVFRVSKADLPEGISHLTVFDSNFRPQCERLWFKPVTKKISITLGHQPAFRSREKIDLTIRASAGGKPVKGNFSIAVLHDDSLSGKGDQGIHEYLWLTSELPGFIEDPEFYFGGHPDVVAATDNLMLTHGWRRFKWHDVLSGKPPALKFLPEYYGHLVSGTVTTLSGEEARGIVTYLSSPDKAVRLYVSRSDEKGQVQFQTQQLYGSRKLIVQTEDPDNHTFAIADPFSGSFPDRTFSDVDIDRRFENAMRDRSVAMQVRYVYGGNTNGEISLATDTIPFYGQGDDSYLLDDYTRFPVMEEVMREYVPKVRVRRSNDEFHFVVVDDVNQTIFKEDPLVLLDGVPVMADEIMDINPLKIRRLDVLARKYYLGALTASGVVSFTTYDGDLAGMQLSPKVFAIDYAGLQQQREFYSPSYTTLREKASRVPDYRKLLYWSSHVETDENGECVTSFYTSDVTGKFRIVVQGLSTDGISGSGAGEFSVAK